MTKSKAKDVKSDFTSTINLPQMLGFTVAFCAFLAPYLPSVAPHVPLRFAVAFAMLVNVVTFLARKYKMPEAPTSITAVPRLADFKK